ncbi:MAG: 50S ribosomal protein L35 [Candidatus Omnitrophica bacterium]|nr:50S ribosomal protein L35 [Candidatus Omnitrophota bacterium]
MPKIKTHKGLAKRFKRTKSGKIKRSKAGRGHLLGHKTRKRKRHLRKSAIIGKTDEKAIKRMLPYSS